MVRIPMKTVWYVKSWTDSKCRTRQWIAPLLRNLVERSRVKIGTRNIEVPCTIVKERANYVASVEVRAEGFVYRIQNSGLTFLFPQCGIILYLRKWISFWPWAILSKRVQPADRGLRNRIKVFRKVEPMLSKEMLHVPIAGP